jgi:ATP-dependent Clp protease ATP-binding subunit ClpB
LDDGRVTDSQGRLINFKNTILIMTSNIGSEYVLDTNEASKETRRERVMDAVRGHFRPEFINRVDEWIVFDPLAKDQVTAIVRQQVERVTSRLADRKIGLRVSDEAVALLSDTGYDPAFGARPVKRAVQSLLETAVAQAILRGDVNEDQTAVVDVDPSSTGKLVVTAKDSPKSANVIA